VLLSDVVISGTRQVQAEQVRSLVKTRPGLPYDPQVVQEDVRKLYLTGLFANVRSDMQEVDDGVKVTFTVREHPSKVEKVEYRGAGHLRKDDLDGITQVRVGTPLNPLANKTACAAIVRRLNEDGRPFASCTLLKGGELGDTEVIFNITEGPKVKVRDVAFTGNTFVTGARLRQQIKSSRPQSFPLVGGTYNQAMVEADTDELMKYYKSFGFHDVHVSREAVQQSGEQEVTVVFHIQEGNIIRLGNDGLGPNVDLRRAPLSPGQMLTYSDQQVASLDMTRQGILETSPDEAVRPSVTPIDGAIYPNNPIKDAMVMVQRANCFSRLFRDRVELSGLETPSGALEEARNPDNPLNKILGPVP
jgi:hypothetical protein